MAKRMGRPEVPANERRDRILRFVVREDELQAIRKKAKSLRLTISEYLRSVAIPKTK